LERDGGLVAEEECVSAGVTRECEQPTLAAALAKQKVNKQFISLGYTRPGRSARSSKDRSLTSSLAAMAKPGGSTSRRAHGSLGFSSDRMDERGSVFPVAKPDVADLDRSMWNVDSPYEKRLTTDGGIEILAKGTFCDRASCLA
jgi:hypothetical protein